MVETSPEKPRMVLSPEELRRLEENKILENKIISLFSSQNSESIKQALSLCTKYGFELRQFELYYKPEQEKTDDHYLENLVDTTSTNQEANSQLSSAELLPSKFYESFPFKERDLLTLSKPSLANLINGCFSSYGSRELIQVFNVREYLAKMASIISLKQQKPFLEKLQIEINSNHTEISDAFNQVISYLDHQAYGRNFWAKQTAQFSKDRYSTAKNEQKLRIEDIPEVEKTSFLESLFSKPNDYVSKHNYIHYPTPIKSLIAETKIGYASFLLHMLKLKWDNKDKIKEVTF